MKNLLFCTLLGLFVSFLGVQEATAQKIGHLNSLEVLNLMPEMKSANSKLEAFKKQKVSKGEAMAKEFETMYVDYMNKKQSGDISPKQEAQLQQNLVNKENAIMKFEQQAQQDLMEEQSKLYQPVFDKVNDAIAKVAKDGGFDLILDASKGGIIFADSESISASVKAQLGL